jgi:PAS domain S-box-containing protein
MIEALRASERQFRDLFESSPDPIFVEDLQGNVLDVNPAACRLHRMPREKLVGKNVLDLVPAEHREAVKSEFPKVAAGKLDTFDGLSLTADNLAVPVAIRVGRMNFHGQPALLLHVRDISARIKMETALRSSERRFRALIEKSTDGVTLITAKGINRYASPAATRILGYTAEELFNTDAFQFVHPDDAPRMKEQLAELLKQPGGSVSTRCRYRHKNGAWLWLQAVGTNLLEVPEVNAIVVNFVDITERMEAEEQMRAVLTSARCLLWHAAVEAAPDSPEKLSWHSFDIPNSDAARVFLPVAMDEGESYAEAWNRSKLPEDLPRAAETGRAAITGGRRGYSVEYRCKLASGETRWIYEDVRIEPLSDTRWRAFGVCTDVTDRKLLEEQLRQAHKMEAVGQLAGGVAHDFNNLLMIIRGYSDLLIEGLKSDQALHGQAVHIQKAADRAAKLIQQLLAFSRKQVLQPKVLDLNTVARELEPMLRRLIGEDIKLLISCTENLGHVKADRGQIEQVIMNLAANARDAMPQGGRLIIETANAELDAAYAARRADLKPGRYVLLAVSDDGVGMDSETRSHLFEPFFTTKQNNRGTGLGLATVYGIVKQSNGHIWVYSEPNQGSVFKIYLPRVDEPETVEPPPPPETPPQRGTETVLLVEDEDEVRTLAGELLERFGYRVLMAPDGNAALRICEKHGEPIHLLVTDVVMPGMSGRVLAQLLVSMHPELKVLYISGYTDATITHHGVLEAGSAFLQKPFTPNALARKVREVIESKRQPPAKPRHGSKNRH